MPIIRVDGVGGSDGGAGDGDSRQRTEQRRWRPAIPARRWLRRRHDPLPNAGRSLHSAVWELGAPRKGWQKQGRRRPGGAGRAEHGRRRRRQPTPQCSTWLKDTDDASQTCPRGPLLLANAGVDALCGGCRPSCLWPCVQYRIHSLTPPRSFPNTSDHCPLRARITNAVFSCPGMHKPLSHPLAKKDDEGNLAKNLCFLRHCIFRPAF